ncbi:MAG: CPBP family glutamic-type intramembrane protease [bacterium]|nr:CPBP family glutamic-type intramembrane protease [bacterium]
MKPNYFELSFLILSSIVYVLLEFIRIIPDIKIVSISIIIAWVGYVVWKAVKNKGILTYWGFRGDNFLPSIRSCLYFTIPAIALLVGYGILTGHYLLPQTFWMICLLYPIWGIIQQFALQVLVHRNLQELIKPVFYRCLLLGLLFCSAHIYDLRLVLLAFPIGFAFSWIYSRYPNLWALGVCHGILGAIVYYFVLGLDPGKEIIGFILQFR